MDDDIKTVLTKVATNQEWLMASSQEQKQLLVDHVADEEVWKKDFANRHAEHGQRLGSIEAEMYFRKRVSGLLKIVGGVVVLALTFKFGDISGYITKWWN